MGKAAGPTCGEPAGQADRRDGADVRPHRRHPQRVPLRADRRSRPESFHVNNDVGGSIGQGWAPGRGGKAERHACAASHSSAPSVDSNASTSASATYAASSRLPSSKCRVRSRHRIRIEQVVHDVWIGLDGSGERRAGLGIPVAAVAPKQAAVKGHSACASSSYSASSRPASSFDPSVQQRRRGVCSGRPGCRRDSAPAARDSVRGPRRAAPDRQRLRETEPSVHVRPRLVMLPNAPRSDSKRSAPIAAAPACMPRS